MAILLKWKENTDLNETLQPQQSVCPDMQAASRMAFELAASTRNGPTHVVKAEQFETIPV